MEQRAVHKIKRGGKLHSIGRIVGGIAWPPDLDTEGCVCVVAEELLPDEVDGKQRHCKAILAAYHRDCDEITRIAVEEFRSKFPEIQFYGHVDAKINTHLYHWNQNRRRPGTHEFYVNQAPYAETDKINFHVKMIRSCVRPDFKVLHFNPETRLIERLNQMPVEFDKATSTDYPAIAALGYALATLRMTQPHKDEDEKEYTTPMVRSNNATLGLLGG